MFSKASFCHKRYQMPLSPRQIRGRSGQSRSQECGGEKEHVPGTSRSRSTIWPHNREIHLNLIYIRVDGEKQEETPAGVYLQWKQKGNRAVIQVRQSSVLQSCGVTDPTAVQLHPLSTLTLSLFPAMPPPPPSSHLLSLPFLLYKTKSTEQMHCVCRAQTHTHAHTAVAPFSHQRKSRRSKFYLVWKTVCVDMWASTKPNMHIHDVQMLTADYFLTVGQINPEYAWFLQKAHLTEKEEPLGLAFGVSTSHYQNLVPINRAIGWGYITAPSWRINYSSFSNTINWRLNRFRSIQNMPTSSFHS